MQKTQFREYTEKLIKDSARPIVIFDLDGTLFNVTHRTLEIMRRFCAQESIRERFETEVELVAKITPDKVRYGLETTLHEAGISRHSERGAEFHHLAEAFWFKRFFTDEFLLFDKVFPGAADCVHWFLKLGVRIVYLSGRDIPNMSRGTLTSLERGGFPHKGHNVSMILKPDYHMDDLLFKSQSMQTIRSEGDVVAAFDNEPANVAMFLQEFPKAASVHFQSEFARWMELKGETLFAIKEFREIGF